MSDATNDINRIVEAGALAPSGENAQPWRFQVIGNTIRVFNIPERDQSLYNWGQRASMVAHGAAIENMVVAAAHLGYKTTVSLLPNSEEPDLVAVIQLRKAAGTNQPLYAAIARRHTNRKPYRTIALTREERTRLLGAVETIEGGKLLLVEEPGVVRRLAEAASKNEVILLENRPLHRFFFSHINWTEEEELTRRVGFYVKTLELAPPQLVAFKAFRHWPLLQLLNKALGVAQFVARENAKVYAQAAAMGAIVIPQNEPADFIAAGRIMERVWLEATRNEVRLQPLTGVLFLSQRVTVGEVGQLSSSHIALVRDTYRVIADAFGVSRGVIAVLFRIGKGEEPSARSMKIPIEQLVQEA